MLKLNHFIPKEKIALEVLRIIKTILLLNRNYTFVTAAKT